MDKNFCLQSKLFSYLFTFLHYSSVLPLPNNCLPVPSFGSFTARCLSGGNSEGLSRHPDWAFYRELLVLGTFDQVSTYLKTIESVHYKTI